MSKCVQDRLKITPDLSAEIGDIFGNGWIDNTDKNLKLIKKSSILLAKATSFA